MTTAIVVFAFITISSLTGLLLGSRLSGRHKDVESRDAVRLISSFLTTLSALVLGLLIASAKANFDEHKGQLNTIAADVIALDRTLSHYGEGAREARIILRSALTEEHGRLSTDNRLRGTGIEQAAASPAVSGYYDMIQRLRPQDENQRTARDRALRLTEAIAATRIMLTQVPVGSIPPPFLLVLVFWLAAMFASFGLFARANAIVIVFLLIGAASVGGAVFLILELDQPLAGLMRLSTASLQNAIDTLANINP